MIRAERDNNTSAGLRRINRTLRSSALSCRVNRGIGSGQMSEGLKIGLTAVAGIIVFVLGQIIQKWFTEPIQEQRKLAGDIVYSIIFHSNFFSYVEHFHEAAEIRY